MVAGVSDPRTFADRDPGIVTRGRINPVVVASPDIVRHIEAKAPRAIGNWNELGADEYARAFTAARTIGYDVVRDLYDGYRAAIAAGESNIDFAARVSPILRDKEWLPELGDKALSRRLKLIFDANLRVSRAVGQWDRIQRNKRLLPYLYYSAVRDNRTRPTHAAMHGTIARVDHPIWARWYPPCGFRCRCTVRQLTRSQALRLGGVLDDAALSERMRLNPDSGFDYNAGIEHERAQLRKVAEVNVERLPGTPPVIYEALQAKGRRAWSADIGDAIDLLQGQPDSGGEA